MDKQENKSYFINFFLLISFFEIVKIPHAQAENILFFFGVSSYSHRIPAWPLAESLAEKGHNVTFVSPFPAKNPNPKIHDFVPKKLVEFVNNWDDVDDVFTDRKENNLLKGWYTLPNFGVMMCDMIYQDKEYFQWMKETKIDLVFIDSLFNDCAYGMAHYWKAKTIIFATSTAFSWYPQSFGLLDESAWIPALELSYPLEMTFLQRIKNSLVPLAWHLHRKWKYLPELEAITKEKLGVIPRFEEIERNTSLIFLNTHYAEEFARSLPPNVISIGGIGWSENLKPLPGDLSKFLEKRDSFIYISFGTHADFTKMGTDTQQAIIGAMRTFSTIQFVWMVSNNSLLQEFPAKNVYIKKWMPQQELLAHPKIKAFITHSGLLGTQEAFTCGVPLISFPVFAEQDYNAERIHRKEYGIRLEITQVKQSELEDAIMRILKDSKYRNNMERVSTLFKDRPMKPLAIALWWTNFVIRHNEEELAALRPANFDHSWGKKRNIDVWLSIVAVLIAILGLLIWIICKILSILLKIKDFKSNGKCKIQ